MKTAIISLSDATYFHLLEDLIDSVLSFPESKNIDLCILDAGMTSEQIKKIESKVYEIKKAEWDIPVSNLKVKGREWLKSQVSRAFLPNYFPSYDKYIWIDSDAWVNSWIAIDLLTKACDKKKLGICSMSDRHTGRVLRVEWFFKNLGFIKSQNYKHAKSSGFSTDIARHIGIQPHLNIGVFSLEGSSNTWKVWQKNLEKALSKGRIFGSEQVAMNVSVYIDNVENNILPYYCNWIPNPGNTKIDLATGKFVEGYLPHHEIGIMHLAGGYKVNNQDMRFDKKITTQVETLDGNFVNKSFRFSI
jgi:hypothetical protein